MLMGTQELIVRGGDNHGFHFKDIQTRVIIFKSAAAAVFPLPLPVSLSLSLLPPPPSLSLSPSLLPPPPTPLSISLSLSLPPPPLSYNNKNLYLGRGNLLNHWIFTYLIPPPPPPPPEVHKWFQSCFMLPLPQAMLVYPLVYHKLRI